jgi:hypothetical protein
VGISDDIEDLKLRIRKTVDMNEQTKLSDLLAQSLDLCEKVKVILRDAEDKEKKELNNSLKEFKQFLSHETARLSKKMGLTEDQFARFNENPENFSKEQWMVMKAVKKRFAIQAKEIKKVIKDNPNITKRKGALLPKPKLPEDWREQIQNNPDIIRISPAIPGVAKSQPESNKKKKVGLRKVKKSKWLKS